MLGSAIRSSARESVKKIMNEASDNSKGPFARHAQNLAPLSHQQMEVVGVSKSTVRLYVGTADTVRDEACSGGYRTTEPGHGDAP